MRKIALVTNKKLHHKYWVYELCKRFDVRLIIHPSSGQKNLKKKIFGKNNIILSLLKILSIVYNIFSPKSISAQLKKGEKKYFSSYLDKYESIDKKIKYDVNSVNSNFTIELLKSHDIDVICFLGGDIAKKYFFDELKNTLVLNFHSGISPFYNGNKTTFHAVSDFRPNFCGGTLMKMNCRIDGGSIISHYLTPIDIDDSPSDLFFKGIIGSVKLYTIALKNLHFLKEYGIDQNKSFKYLVNNDWNIINDVKLNLFKKYNKIRPYLREEEIISYTNDNDINDLYQLSLSRILKK